MTSPPSHSPLLGRDRDRLFSGHWITLIPAALVAGIVLPFRYETAVSEPDLAAMLAAFVYGEATGLQEHAGQHYGVSFSFGYYRLLYWLAPSGMLGDPLAVAQLINGVGIFFGLFAMWSCAEYLSSVVGRAAGTAAALLTFASPMMLPVVFSGHPLVAACAFLFLGSRLLIAMTALTQTRWSLGVAAVVFIIAGLTMRAEIVLAFPFVAFASTQALSDSRAAWKAVMLRGLLCAVAFIAFLYLQRPVVASSGGASSTLASYLAGAKSVAVIGAGVGVWVIGMGLVMFAAALVATVWMFRTKSDLRGRFVVMLSALLLPALLLWLPDPLPARHLFFPMMAAAVLVALALASLEELSTQRVLIFAVVLVACNQVVAEMLHPVVAAKHKWPYESLTGRRTTPRAPTGAFILDQASNRTLAVHLSQEAIRLAGLRPPKLLFFGDSPHYVIAHLLSLDPKLRWSERLVDGIDLIELRSDERKIVLVRKYKSWPRDVQAEVLRDAEWKSWPVYVQPSTRSAFDRAAVEPDRLIKLD